MLCVLFYRFSSFFFSIFVLRFVSNRTKSNQRWMKLRTTVQLSSAIQKKPPLKREDSFLKRFSTRQIPETQVSAGDMHHWMSFRYHKSSQLTMTILHYSSGFESVFFFDANKIVPHSRWLKCSEFVCTVIDNRISNTFLRAAKLENVSSNFRTIENSIKMPFLISIKTPYIMF